MMIAEYDPASEPGAKGALLSREGLYSSHIIEWRRARDAGALASMADKPRRRPAAMATWEAERLRGGERAAAHGAGQDPRGVGRRGKCTRDLGSDLRERGHRSAVD